ncbi:beta-parvin-like isoform X2 [Gordionus sp. m RMFG-2023]|uniref:beta-parvin-like isoform X2 n=1 Tax=Gordionus sp. m RMFG-2023 TaxID=3053472 RepID=UPI0031FD1D72
MFSGKKDKKDETLVDKLATFGRRRRIKEAEEAQNLVKEGVIAIDSPDQPINTELLPSEYILEENEERCMIESSSREDPNVKEYIHKLIEWINDELVVDRILVKNIEEDLYDGQVLGKLIEKLADIKLEIVELTQTEEGQKQKLKIVLGAINHVLNISSSQAKWTVESIRGKDLLAIISILSAMARRFAPRSVILSLPQGAILTSLSVRKVEGMLQIQRTNHTLGLSTDENRMTDNQLISDDLSMAIGKKRRDAFDTLFEHAPQKLEVVEKSLLTFARKHLNILGIDVYDLEKQFNDGVYLILLMGQLENYFIPLYAYNYHPQSFEEKMPECPSLSL